MSYERYKDHRLAPDDNGCWEVLDSNYQMTGTYPSKAAAKRAIDDLMPSTKNNTREDEFEQWLDRQLTGDLATGDLETDLRMAVATIRDMPNIPKDFAVQPLIRFIAAFAGEKAKEAVANAFDWMERNPKDFKKWMAKRDIRRGLDVRNSLTPPKQENK